MSDIDAVLFANEVFYVSFASGDVDAMDELWSSQAPISCIHPGWESLRGREDVVESWRSIIRGGAPAIRCREPEVFLYGNTATVLCYEEVEGDFLIATNVFVREATAWKMVHHQAGPTRGKPQDDLANEKKPKVN